MSSFSNQVFNLVRLSVLPLAAVGGVLICFAYLSLFLYHDALEKSFLLPGIALSASAFLIWLPARSRPLLLKNRMAPMFAVLAWLVTGFCSAIPIATITGASAVQAVFESFSALTTCGATILSGLDDMPPSFLMYRQFLQWMGGLGVVIFVVAVLPNLDAGGMRLLKAEVPGPAKEDKLVARTRNTAHAMWLVYLLITVLCAVSYRLVGMNWYEAIAHSFSTVSTGGFSVYDDSLGYFSSEWVYLVADVFMLLGALNFALHFGFLQSSRLKLYWENEESRTFLISVLVLTLLVCWVVYPVKLEDGLWLTFNHALFILISVMTSTGFGAENFTAWPQAALFLLLISSYMGGCAGSTAGGSKIMRIVIMFKLVRREIRRLVHPRGVFSVRYQGRPVDDAIVRNTLAFFFFMLASAAVLTGLLIMDGLDLWTAISAVTACINVLGPAFGTLSSNFQPLNEFGLNVLTFAMILGRLEYLTILVLIVPQYWKS
ncbi:MAG: potassium transporter TrkG [Reinekea sp.]|jgi:trk system potassium uptake protein